ncbi:MAG: hypothetical protein H6563_07735 [Lewinellaceae bacterium]|nr:hypothetical protein [Lewinellaceae bacterium]
MNRFTKQRLAYGVLLLGLFFELGFQTFLKRSLGPYWSPLVWTLAGLTVAGAGLWLFARKTPETAPGASTTLPRWAGVAIVAAVFLAGCALTFFRVWPVFDEFPIDPNQSDVIPSMQYYVQRFLRGETVYAPMPFSTWTIQPPYLTMTWLPYTIPELLKIDYRWLALGAFYGIFGIYVGRLVVLRRSLPEIVLKTVLPFGMLWLLIVYDRYIFGHSVELTIVAFYLFLALTLFHKRPWFMAVGIVICLLSRYAFTFWLPAYLVMLWIGKGFKPAFATGLYTLLGVLLLYILPFWIKDPGILKRGLDYYEQTAIGQWQTQPWQEPGARPFHLDQGLSFAILFYDFGNGTAQDRLAANRTAQLWVCLLAAVGLAFGYYFWKKRGLDSRLYALGSLKAYLTIFYAFLHVPFSYLFMVPLFLTVAVVYEVRASMLE